MQFINKRRAMAQSQSGFTLIELLVVIAILGILAGVVVFAIGGVTDNGQESACKLEARTVRTAIQAYRAQNSVYPDAAVDLFDGQFLEAAAPADLKLVSIAFNAGPPATKPTLTWVGGAGGKCGSIAGIGNP